MTTPPNADDRLRQAIDNARRLAAALVERDPGRAWDRPIDLAATFATPSSDPDSAPKAPAVVRSTESGRVAVVGWDLGHNPAGRAMVLAHLHAQQHEVDLVGPLWATHGTEVWAPIRDAGLRTIAFGCTTMADFLPKAYAVAGRHRYELVHVCKPRLPAMILGSLLARASGCPLVVDIDDDELAFEPDPDDLDRYEPLAPEQLDPQRLGALTDPTSALGTRLGVTLARHAHVRTVSNIALAREFGGVMVRHARSESTFDPARAQRALGRNALGAAATDFVVLFVGTPRPHKGLAVVVDALRRMDDDVVLHIVGAEHPARVVAELGAEGVRVEVHRPTPFTALPDLLAAADAVALMQDPDDPISAFQIPSKISDALALGRPVIATDLPPIADLDDTVVLRADDAAELAAQLERLRIEDQTEPNRRRRAAFLAEFSEGVNRARIELAAADAAAQHETTPDPIVESTIDLATTVFEALTARRSTPALEPTSSDDGTDLVVFWKQNDTHLYGRRCEMLAAHLARDPRIRKVLYVDAPLSVDDAGGDALEARTAGDERSARLTKLLERRLGLADGAVHHRTFLYDDLGGHDPLTGRPLPGHDGFADWVATEMADLGMRPDRSVAWVCPVIEEFPAVHETLGFARVVVDLVDDERMLDVSASRRRELDANYRQVLAIADHAFTNCTPNAEAFAPYAAEITVVPNGAEVARFDPERRAIGADEAPVMAYVGHLRDRIDWELLGEVCRARPGYRLVLAGASEPHDPVHDFVTAHHNVELVGLVPYPDLPAFLAGVDVAVIPHLAGDQTDRMNPLKAYNFFAAGVPMVATEIANLDDAIDTITYASSSRRFAAAVDEAIEHRRRGRSRPDPSRLAAIDWSARAASVLDTLDAAGTLPLDR